MLFNLRTAGRTSAGVLLCMFLALMPSFGASSLPRNLIIPDGTGMLIPRPSLKPTGDPIVISNSPEELKDIPVPAALYRATIKKSRFRVFFHHMNATKNTLQVGAAITNPADAKGPIELYVNRNSQLLTKETRICANSRPALAGTICLRNWFKSQAKDQLVARLNPGETRCVLQPVAVNATVAGMYDFVVKSNVKKPNVMVSVIACENEPTAVSDLPLLPAEELSGLYHRRGVFPHSDRYGKVECDLSRVWWLDLAGPHAGKYNHLLENEMERGVGDPCALNPGNYGVVYTLDVTISNSSSKSRRVMCIANCAGGAGYSMLTLNGAYKEHEKVLPAFGSWVYNNLTVPANGRRTFRLQYSLPGGCSGAHRFYFWPA